MNLRPLCLPLIPSLFEKVSQTCGNFGNKTATSYSNVPPFSELRIVSVARFEFSLNKCGSIGSINSFLLRPFCSTSSKLTTHKEMIGSYTNIGSNITICYIITLNWHMELTTHCNFTRNLNC